jgi:hypothetical protein
MHHYTSEFNTHTSAYVSIHTDILSAAQALDECKKDSSKCLHLQINEGSAESIKKEARNIEKKMQGQEVEPALRRKAFQASLFSEAMLAKNYLEKVSHTHSRYAHAHTHKHMSTRFMTHAYTLITYTHAYTGRNSKTGIEREAVGRDARRHHKEREESQGRGVGNKQRQGREESQGRGV